MSPGKAKTDTSFLAASPNLDLRRRAYYPGILLDRFGTESVARRGRMIRNAAPLIVPEISAILKQPHKIALFRTLKASPSDPTLHGPGIFNRLGIVVDPLTCNHELVVLIELDRTFV